MDQRSYKWKDSRKLDSKTDSWRRSRGIIYCTNFNTTNQFSIFICNLEWSWTSSLTSTPCTWTRYQPILYWICHRSRNESRLHRYQREHFESRRQHLRRRWTCSPHYVPSQDSIKSKCWSCHNSNILGSKSISWNITSTPRPRKLQEFKKNVDTSTSWWTQLSTNHTRRMESMSRDHLQVLRVCPRKNAQTILQPPQYPRCPSMWRQSSHRLLWPNGQPLFGRSSILC